MSNKKIFFKSPYAIHPKSLTIHNFYHPNSLYHFILYQHQQNKQYILSALLCQFQIIIFTYSQKSYVFFHTIFNIVNFFIFSSKINYFFQPQNSLTKSKIDNYNSIEFIFQPVHELFLFFHNFLKLIIILT